MREKDSRIDYLRATAHENELEKQEMKLRMEETYGQTKGHESSIVESE